MNWFKKFFFPINEEAFWENAYNQTYEDFDLYKEFAYLVDKAGIKVPVKIQIVDLIIEKPHISIAITTDFSKEVFYGLTRCSDKDIFNISFGMKLALQRATKKLIASF